MIKSPASESKLDEDIPKDRDVSDRSIEIRDFQPDSVGTDCCLQSGQYPTRPRTKKNKSSCAFWAWLKSLSSTEQRDTQSEGTSFLGGRCPPSIGIYFASMKGDSNDDSQLDESKELVDSIQIYHSVQWNAPGPTAEERTEELSGQIYPSAIESLISIAKGAREDGSTMTLGQMRERLAKVDSIPSSKRSWLWQWREHYDEKLRVMELSPTDLERLHCTTFTGFTPLSAKDFEAYRQPNSWWNRVDALMGLPSELSHLSRKAITRSKGTCATSTTESARSYSSLE